MSWACSCQGHTQNHYYGTGGSRPGAGWTRGGFAGYLFIQNLRPGEMVALQRFKRVSGGTVDYAYATEGSGAAGDYASTGFVNQGTIGYTLAT